MSVQVSYKKQTAFYIIGLIIILAVIELIANAWWQSEMHCEFEENEIFNEMSEKEKRNMCLEFYNVRTSGTEIVPNQSSESININSHGFRGPEITVERQPEIFRIFMLGGSTMFGMGATSDSTTIPGYTQSLFDNALNNNSVQVINAGIQDANTKTESRMIEQRILNFQPNLIVMYDGWNDLRENFEVDVTIDNWKSICDIGKEKNFDVVIILQPIAGFGNKVLTEQEAYYASTGTDYKNNLLMNNLSLYDEIAGKLSMLNSCTITVDMRNAFDNYIEPIYWDQGHVSDKGNLVIAELIFKKILILIEEDDIQQMPSTYQISERSVEKELGFEENIRNIISYYKTPIMISNLFG
jgi:lysophospholipase L1-like esterase